MSDNSFSLDTEFYGSDGPLKHPPKILFIAGLLSVLLGTLIGVYGIVSAGTASNSQQYLVGVSGYVLTALLPIILLQIILVKHTRAIALNQEEPYDSYAGEQIVGIALSNAHSQPLLDILQVCTAHEGLGEASVVIVVGEKLG